MLLIDGVPLADPERPNEFLLGTSTAKQCAAIAQRIGEGLQKCADKG